MVDFGMIAELLGLEDGGPGALIVCPLPEHADTQASMKIWTDEGRFYCFGCEERGTFVELYAAVRGLDQDGAAEEIERLTGQQVTAPKPVARGPEMDARGIGEKALAALHGHLTAAEHAALGERLDKICWAYRKRKIVREQLEGAIQRFVRELPAVP